MYGKRDWWNPKLKNAKPERIVSDSDNTISIFITFMCDIHHLVTLLIRAAHWHLVFDTYQYSTL